MNDQEHKHLDAMLDKILEGHQAIHSEIAAVRVAVSDAKDQRGKLENRVGALEGRVGRLELSGAEGKGVPAALDDHEARIRSLERITWKVMAVAFLGSGIGGFVAWWISNSSALP